MAIEDGVGRRTRNSEWSSGDTAWAVWVAVVPILFAVGVLAFAFVDDNRSTLLGDVLSLWYFVGFFGSVVYAPVAGVSLLGAAALRRRFRFGRCVSSVGCIAVLLMCCLMVWTAVSEAITDDKLHDPYSWTAPLSPGEAVVFAIPYVLIATVNVYLIARLWKLSDSNSIGPSATTPDRR
jgi:hypothetical protein